MDQMKNMLAVLKKHHFWILSGLAVVIGLVLWWFATGSVDKAREARAGEINKAFQQVNTIRNTPDYPNDKCTNAVNQETGELKAEVLKIWKALYEKQQEKNPLPEVLTDDFKMRFQSLRGQPDVDIGPGFRREYWEFIGNHVRTLPLIVNYRRLEPLEPTDIEAGSPEDSGGHAGRPVGSNAALPGYNGAMGPRGAYSSGGAGQAAPPGMKLVGVVDWAKEDLNRLMLHFNWQQTPSTEEVRLAQEDLWVYEALLRIIAETNGRAVKYQRDAAIKQIQALQIGADAVMAWQTAPGGAIIGGPGAAGGPGGRPEYDGYVGSSAGPGPRPPAGSYGEGPGGPGQYPASPTDNRYVDGEGNPLGAAQEHPFAEFKLMPIRMLLVMNQTKLQKLLVECANSSMPVEVRSLAMGMAQGSMPGMGGLTTPIGPPAGHQGYGSGGAGYDGGRMPEYDGYQGSGVGPRAPGGFSGQTLSIQRRNLDVSLDLRGTICIYNPPDEAKLGTGTAADKTAEPPAAAPASAPAQTPASQTPPAQTPPAGPAPASGAPGGGTNNGG